MGVSVYVLAFAVPMIVTEQLLPGSPQARRRLWWARAICCNVIQAAIVYLAAATWDRWLGVFHLLPGHLLGTIGGAAVGYLLITFIYYWWHRARHEIPLLWRWLHQIHHSPARLEAITTFYKHPLEILANSILTVVTLHVVVGLTPAAATLAVTIAGIAELFYHWNVHTPRWLGFCIQRPESHRVHHRSSYHRNNYSDLPLWDILFGTFENPKSYPRDCGFSPHRELMLWSMLTGRNVHNHSFNSEGYGHETTEIS